MNRRQFLAGSALAAVLRGQSSYKNELPDTLVNYFAQRFGEIARPAPVRTSLQAEDRNRLVRERMRQMLWSLPTSPPLTTRVGQVVERRGYRIEHLSLPSGAGQLYLPSETRGKVPAVLLQRGHFDAERMWPDYHQLHYDLVRNGIAVLSFDPLGMGLDLSLTLEHFMLGGILTLAGENLASYMVSDAMGALDYLAGRAEIDSSKLGCADYTDTGWTPAMLAALDDRVKCCVLHPHGSARRWPLNKDQWNLLDDPEQFLPGAAKQGVDLIDILAAVAPRPMLALVEDATGDFDASAGYLKNWYALHGNAQQFSVQSIRQGEDWPKTFRVETVRWFLRWLAQDSRTVVESAAPAEPAPRVQAASRPMSSKMSTPGALPSLDQIREVLCMGTSKSRVEAREFPPQRFSAYRFNRVEILTEPGIYVPGGLYVPERPNGMVVVYTSGDVTTFVADVDEELAAPKADEPPTVETPADIALNLVDQGYTVLLIDVRGLGETAPRQVRRSLRGPWEHVRNNDAALGMLASQLGLTLIGMRVFDLLRISEYAARWGKVILAGEGMGALWALFAGALDPNVARVVVKDGLIAYRMLLERDRHMQASSQFPFGVLKQFDLPQVAALIAPRPLTISGPVDAMKTEVGVEAAAAFYQPVAEAYRDVPERFRLVRSIDMPSLVEKQLDADKRR